MKITPITSNGRVTYLYHNVMINCGHIEEASMSTLICRHYNGFSDPKEMLLDLHRTFKNAYIETGALSIEDAENPAALAQTIKIAAYCNMNDQPGGATAWMIFDEHDWEIPGPLVTGMSVELLEDGERILSCEKTLMNILKCLRKNFPLHIIN